MGRYLDIAKKVQRERSERSELSPASVTILPLQSTARVGGVPIPIPPTTIDLNALFEALRQLHVQQSSNLPGGIIRVRLSDWRQSSGLDQWEFWRAMKLLEEEGRIIREHGYARPR